MKRDFPKIVVSDRKGRIHELPSLEATGMKGGAFFCLHSEELIKLPYGSELFMLPDRMPVGYDYKCKRFVTPEKFFAVAAFLSPGYAVTYSSSYKEADNPNTLPLFSYGAVSFYKGHFYAAAVKVDRELRQDLRFMSMSLIKRNVKKYRKIFPDNKLVRHLEKCALLYGCPAAKNFFLSRYEAPLPTSPYCNAGCIGCISYQPSNECSVTQPRIKFIPTAEEVAEAALHHINNVKDPVVSFGQGCEGEPLMAAKAIEKSIKLIRSATSKGIININTNASRPGIVAKLFDAGLNSIRVSLNSARREYYSRYFKPRGYGYRDVIESIKIAKKKSGFVSINYLTMPGFTDSIPEFTALQELVERGKIDMIQWRNLNFDPLKYFTKLKIPVDKSKLVGIRQAIRLLKKRFPNLMIGYFNPSKGRIRRNLQ